MKNYHRRDVLRTLMQGSGAWALRAAVTGLPVAFLMDPLREARAEDRPTADPAKAQFLVLALSDGGEPINCNGPGSFAFPRNMHHSIDPAMQPTPLRLGAKTETAAQCWSTLPQWALNRAMFLQHSTFAGQHGMIGNVLRMMGRTKRGDSTPSIYANYLAPTLKTVQLAPISVDPSSVILANGIQILGSAPMAWKALIGQYEALPEAMQKVRDQTTDRIYATLKKHGTRAQIRYLDTLAKTGVDARSLGSKVGTLLNGISDDGAESQLKAAVAICKMNLAPVVCVHLNFGGDNHADPTLENETKAHKTSIAALSSFFSDLKANGLEDQVTFASLSVFGRNFGVADLHGRDHWGPHTSSVVIGRNVRAGLYGGAVARGGDYYATGIDSATGAGVADGGDIRFEDTLAALGKKLGAALGLSTAVLDEEISGGKVVVGALV
jgi:Protein of unknown function (DUF1501)